MRRLLFALFILFFGLEVAEAKKQIVVDLSKQEAFAYENGRLVFSGWVSTGKPGHRTPTGYFRVLEKDIDHVSSKYPRPNGGAKMHYALRINNYGIAMHLGYVPNYPASHGCIRMQNGFAQKMYHWANVGTPVLIKGIPPRYVSRLHHSSPTELALNSTSSSSSIANYAGGNPLSILSGMPIKKSSSAKKTTAKKSHKRKYRAKRHHKNYKRHHRKSYKRVASKKEEKLPVLALLK